MVIENFGCQVDFNTWVRYGLALFYFQDPYNREYLCFPALLFWVLVSRFYQISHLKFLKRLSIEFQKLPLKLNYPKLKSVWKTSIKFCKDWWCHLDSKETLGNDLEIKSLISSDQLQSKWLLPCEVFWYYFLSINNLICFS